MSSPSNQGRPKRVESASVPCKIQELCLVRGTWDPITYDRLRINRDSVADARFPATFTVVGVGDSKAHSARVSIRAKGSSDCSQNATVGLATPNAMPSCCGVKLFCRRHSLRSAPFMVALQRVNCCRCISHFELSCPDIQRRVSNPLHDEAI